MKAIILLLEKLLKFPSLCLKIILLSILLPAIKIRSKKTKYIRGSKKQNNIKIGIIAYPHKNIPQGLIGGGETINNLLKKALTDAGYKVEMVLFDQKIPVRTNIFFKLLLGLPHQLGLYINTIAHNYDLLICEAGTCFGLKHPKVINLFHFSAYGYRKFVPLGFRPNLHLEYIYSALRQKACTKNTYNVAVSNFLSKIMKEQGIPAQKVITNCIDTELFKPAQPRSSNTDHYLYTGGFDHLGKGFDLLEKLAQKGLSIDCYTNHERTGKLNYFNSIPHEKMPELYNKYKILLYPSRFETCGLVPLEAMACGLPVIMGNVGVGRELQEELPEFVVDGYNAKAVAEYLQKLKLINENYANYSQKARAYVLKMHSFAKFKAEWLNLVKTKLDEA